MEPPLTGPGQANRLSHLTFGTIQKVSTVHIFSYKNVETRDILERGMTKRGFLGCRSLLRIPYHQLGMHSATSISTFPNGWPGFGLLLLRLGVGIALIFLGINDFSRALGEPITIARDLIAAAGGIFLLAGLGTPVTGSVLAVDQLWTAFSQHFSQLGSQWIHIFLTVLSAAVAMLVLAHGPLMHASLEGSGSISEVGVGSRSTKGVSVPQPSRGFFLPRSRDDLQAAEAPQSVEKGPAVKEHK
jgi:hypothetical protein